MSYYKELRDTWDGDSPFPSDDQFKEACAEVDRLRAEVDQLRKLVVKKDEALQSAVRLDTPFASTALALTPATLASQQLIDSTELAELKADKGRLEAGWKKCAEDGELDRFTLAAMEQPFGELTILRKMRDELVPALENYIAFISEVACRHAGLIISHPWMSNSQADIDKGAALRAAIDQARGRDEGK